jgi:hypothetical protein
MKALDAAGYDHAKMRAGQYLDEVPRILASPFWQLGLAATTFKQKGSLIQSTDINQTKHLHQNWYLEPLHGSLNDILYHLFEITPKENKTIVVSLIGSGKGTINIVEATTTNIAPLWRIVTGKALPVVARMTNVGISAINVIDAIASIGTRV